jgi:hypothetical protein
MGLTKKEKQIELNLRKQWSKERAKKIWHLYLSIRSGRKKFVTDLTLDEAIDAIVLLETGIIAFGEGYIYGSESTVDMLFVA